MKSRKRVKRRSPIVSPKSSRSRRGPIRPRSRFANSRAPAQTYRALHDNFLQRYMESVQQQSFPIPEARLITQASRPLKRSHPKMLLTLAVAIGGGAILGFGAAMVRDLWDRRFRTASQIEDLLQTTCLATIPVVKWAPAKPGEASADKRGLARDKSVFWTVIDSPFSTILRGNSIHQSRNRREQHSHAEEGYWRYLIASKRRQVHRRDVACVAYCARWRARARVGWRSSQSFTLSPPSSQSEPRID